MLVALGGARRRATTSSCCSAFAASAATAVATARTVEEQRLRDAMRAAEEERRRWARELHDDTLQGLGGLRMLLNAALRSDDPSGCARPSTAVERIEEEIDGLRGLIRELRPAALDELGLAAAIEGLADADRRTRSGIAVTADVRLLGAAPRARARDRALPDRPGGGHQRRPARGRARASTIAVTEADGVLHVRVARRRPRASIPARPRDGFGLTGMRERVALLHGELEVASSPPGTTVTAALPASEPQRSQIRTYSRIASISSRTSPVGSP